MTEDLVRPQSLQTQFPRLFNHTQSRSAFACGEGWLNLIVDLSTELTKILDTEPEATLEVRQIKEKFGRMRFSYRLTTASETVANQIRTVAADASKKSESTCELCGSDGVLRERNYWLTVRCVTCDGLGH